MSDELTVPCKTCGTETYQIGTRLCHLCWEVEHRLADYIRRGGANARRFISTTLANLDLEERSR